MELMLTEVCEYLNNYFWDKKIKGTFTITNGELHVIGLKEGQYYRILGSTANEGVHIYPSKDLTDETFSGEIWAMAVPQTVIALTSEIEAWKNLYNNPTADAMSPFNSESFNNYSYSKSGGANGMPMSWTDVYAGRLNKYRRLRGAS